MSVFECRIQAGALRPDGNEALRAAYFSEAEISGLPISPWMQVVMPVMFGERERAYFQKSRWRPG